MTRSCDETAVVGANQSGHTPGVEKNVLGAPGALDLHPRVTSGIAVFRLSHCHHQPGSSPGQYCPPGRKTPELSAAACHPPGNVKTRGHLVSREATDPVS